MLGVWLGTSIAGSELKITMPEFGVIVLGAGLAGYCAALAAAETGATVLLAEKCPEVGGSTVLSNGMMAFASTPLQQKLGIKDSPSLLLDDLRAVGGPHTQDDLLRTYASGQEELYKWLTSIGIEFTNVELSSGQSAERSHATDPGELIAKLHSVAESYISLEIWTKTIAVRLNRSGNDGPVVGVIFDQNGKTIDVGARRGVVIATGGFSRSEELLLNFAPNQAKAMRGGGRGNVGDGLRMAWRLGAGMRDMGEIKGTYGAHISADNDGQEMLLMFYRGGIIVNRGGKRFIDESLSYKLLGDGCLAQEDAVSWEIFDQRIFDESPSSVRLFDPRPALNRGLLIKASSIHALAKMCGIDPAGLAQTIATYNADCLTGRDSVFGRDGLCNHIGKLVAIDKPMFFAYPATTAVLATYCGLTVDTLANVLDVYEEPIEGLYAAGEVTGGFHGRAFMTGSSLGKSALFGRIAGREAASRVI